MALEKSHISFLDITSSRAFRRMKGKTQLFSPTNNDHYRNRLTHTLEVASVAEEISHQLLAREKHLEIDQELVLKIALCHDLGHTPFGHVGERTLHSILSGKDRLGGLLPDFIGCDVEQGFKHNVFSGKILLRDFGLADLKEDSLLDGVIKHTKPFYANEEKLDYGTSRIVSSFPKLKAIEGYAYNKDPISIEGKIVKMADEIAQRGSDFGDSILSKILLVSDCKLLRESFFDCGLSDPQKVEEKIRSSLIGGVVYSEIDKSVAFTEAAKNANSGLDNFICEKIRNSYLIRSEDCKHEHIIRQVFKAFYVHPSQLDDQTLRRIYSDVSRNDGGVFSNKFLKNFSTFVFDKDETLTPIRIATFSADISKKISTNTLDREEKVYLKIFLSNIAFYIASMTDEFITKKYMKLYNGDPE